MTDRAIVGDQLVTRRPICDFCSGPEPRWAYATSDFTLPMDSGDADWGSHGGWAACDPCARYIEREDWPGLVKRICKRMERVSGVRAALHRGKVDELIVKFRASKIGEPRVEIDPNDPRDPTRDDQAGEMMRDARQGMQVRIERDAEARMRDGMQATFSADALSELNDSMGRWVATRIARRFQDTGIAPQAMEVEVTVRLDDEPQEGPSDASVRFRLVDGERRWRAAQ